MTGKPRRLPGGQVFLCTGDGCPEHEPPDPDCDACSEAFYSRTHSTPKAASDE